MGFEPTRAEHNGLAVHRLNHSAKNGAKGTARRGEKEKKRKERGGKEGERKGGKKEENVHYIIFLSILLPSQHCLHTVMHLLQGLSSLTFSCILRDSNRCCGNIGSIHAMHFG